LSRWHTCRANLRNVYDHLKGRPTPGLCHPRTSALGAAQCRVIRYYYVVAITTSRKQRDLPPPPQLSFASLIRALSVPRSIFLRSFAANPELPFTMNITLITKYRLLRLSIFRRRDTLSFIYENFSAQRDRQKTPGAN
jgi:hypothetical protein